MPLIPSSPEWDAYVRRRRQDAEPSWDRWHQDGAHLNTFANYCVMAYIGPLRESRPEYVLTSTGDRSAEDIYDVLRGGSDLVIVDDWNTLAVWINEWSVPDDDWFVEMTLTPDTIWCQEAVVVLTEQLADVFFAPPDMDTTDIYAWLDLFRLPDTIDARKELARFVVGGRMYASQRPAEWQYVSWADRSIAESIADRQVYIEAPSDVSAITTAVRAVPHQHHEISRRSEPDGRLCCTYRASDLVRVPHRPLSDYSDVDVSITNCDRRTTVSVTTRHQIGALYNWRYESILSQRLPLASRGFTPGDVRRSVPLDVTLLAHAGPGRHIVEPCR